MTTRYLNKDQIIAIHKRLIDEFGGLYGIRDESLLESAIGRYQSGYYKNEIEEAAALMESLGGNHPFIDGNKRIAVTAPSIFLLANGYETKIDEEEAFQTISGLLERHEFTFVNLEPWLQSNIIRGVKSPDNSSSESIADYGISALMDALISFSGALAEWNFLLENRVNEINVDDFEVLKTDPSKLYGILNKFLQWVRLVSADMNVYSDRLSLNGEQYLQSWAIVVQNLEMIIPQVSNEESLQNFSKMLHLYNDKTIQLGDNLSKSFEIIYSTSIPVNELKLTLNQLPNDHAVFIEMTQTINGYEQALDNYKKGNDELGDHLNIMVYGASVLISKIGARLTDLNAENN